MAMPRASFEWGEDEIAEFDRLLTSRTAGVEKIGERLAAHARGEQNHKRRRARGEAFARKLVWQHLEEIIQRHAHLIENAQGFLNALAVNPKHGGLKNEAIFYYHRKTPAEMRAHFDKKKARCAYAGWLGLPDAAVDKRGHISVRRLSLLEFLATRDVQLTDGRRIAVGETLAQRLLDWIPANPQARTAKEAKPIVDELRQSLVKTHGAKLAPESGKNKSDLNVWFFTSLRDLIAPSSANRNKNASLSAATAERLFTIATSGGLLRASVKEALADYYEFRKRPLPDLYGIYPQVEFLLGQRVKKVRSRHGKKRGERAHEGILQRIFTQLAAKHALPFKPEYCVVETARDLPRNQKQKAKYESENVVNRKRREELFKKFGLTDTAKGSARRRVELFDQQQGICPFTGKQLGDKPLGDALEIEHLYPAESGGLTINDNLALTFKTVNAQKGKRTPREFAVLLGIPFEEMVGRAAKMRWGKSKREFFAWEFPDEIPPFGNTTRISQLAKQLYAEVADWMDINAIEDASLREKERARRIGSPTGFFTAACRRSWELPLKDRSDLTHHLVDAVILSHIPPGKGQNYVGSGGIFSPAWDAQAKREILTVLPLGPKAEDVGALVAPDAPDCPIIRHRSSSSSRSLHDETQWSVRADGTLAARSEMPPKDTLDPAKIRKLLLESGIPLTYRKDEKIDVSLIPSDSAIERWLNSKTDEPLRLLNGTPVRAIWKTSGKGSFKDNPVGFHASKIGEGQYSGVKSIHGRWDALEIWRAWDTKKKRWAYFKRLMPAPAVRKALRKIGISWSKKSNRPWRAGGMVPEASLKKLLSGSLPPFACRAPHPSTNQPLVFRLGDVFLIGITADGKLAKRGAPFVKKEWVQVSAVMAEGGGRIRFRKQLFNDKWKEEPMSSDDLAFLAGLPPADDPSSYPRQREPGIARPERTADFGLE